jgi:D-alanyl-D-alanine dipeptidase
MWNVSMTLGAVVVAANLAYEPALSQSISGLPHELVRLTEVDPTIQEDMRYASSRNFTSAPIPGYEINACLIRRDVANALSAVQKTLLGQRKSLKVFDCYRPPRAVAALVDYGKRHSGISYYHPRTSAGDLVRLGYIAPSSQHSSGNAVDLSIVDLSVLKKPERPKPGEGCLNLTALELGNELDMGTSFDCFDPLSATNAKGLTAEQRSNRNLLRRAMEAAGFRNYEREWWHYTFIPRPKT